MNHINSFYLRLITWIILSLILLFFMYSPVYFNLFIILVLLEILIFEWKNFFKITDLKFWFIMPFYPILPFILILSLNTPVYKILLVVSIILAFSFDTGAYITGKLIGKHKIAPKISPAKTWEGVFGGYLFCLLTLSFIFWFFNKPFSLFIAWFTLIISALAFFGDLFESYLKRKAGIKDSGNLLPGHGGFLDRFDSVLFITTFCYICRDFLIKYL
ncbi:MAG: phosphatidate cytidylyltransferase [Candidatus Babeliales bacterium]|nr:phosphatidate cytidylyltransferase [Candidatus Babeliales bacterium]